MDTFAAEKPGAQAFAATAWVDQVLSPDALRKTGYFDAAAVTAARQKLPTMRKGLGRTGLEMGLTAVTATQLWHHLYISGDLADIPSKIPG
jgi:asparagine synthase (glutamine-hydrolysing)